MSMIMIMTINWSLAHRDCLQSLALAFVCLRPKIKGPTEEAGRGTVKTRL